MSEAVEPMRQHGPIFHYIGVLVSMLSNYVFLK